jgi:hypothetical protein
VVQEPPIDLCNLFDPPGRAVLRFFSSEVTFHICLMR